MRAVITFIHPKLNKKHAEIAVKEAVGCEWRKKLTVKTETAKVLALTRL